MFTVEGVHDGTPYAVVVDPDRAGNTMGCVSGSGKIATLLEMNQGVPFVLSPTGGDAVLDVDDPWLVHEWLLANTRVLRTEGDAPITPEEWVLPAGAIA